MIIQGNQLDSLPKAEDWEAFAESYKRIAEVAVMKPVQALLQCLDDRLPLSGAVGILDNGSGPGIIMSSLIERYGPQLPPDCVLTCVDYAPAMIDQVDKARIKAVEEDADSAWGRVEGKVLDALDLHSIADESQSHIAAGLLYNLTTDPAKCLSECKRTLQPGGVLAVSAWEGNDWIEMLRVVPLIKPDLKTAIQPKWSTVDAVRWDLELAGFREVHVQRIPIKIPFTSHALFVDTLMRYQPRMVAMLRTFTEDEKTELRRLLMNEMKVICPSQPGMMSGAVMVGAGVR
uniref:Methyltransferase ucsB n=1 Tax=Acremonium sp. TaxID=2046025 RepID=UCSB_ACRSP|nr:RecName: Full=Methyltransferase ucsB; AltName: Full=UCS1025A pyrrolizidinone biosynthesis cluster protein B [Acremonium sp.]QBC88146.1 UcsB [Acremonium sp.]